MVGFGSSLRMSRRRGWEDAYLDYQSLRLLLTQIEAVYEEEDWKRGEDSNANLAEAGDIAVAAAVSDDDDINHDGWKGLLESAWKTTRAVVTGKSYHRYNSSRRRRRYPRNVRGSNTSIPSSAWVSNDYFDYSPDQHRRKRKKDKGSHDRALDKAGWRSPGATDYRDELFLISDEEDAYGYYEDENDWEDEEDIDSIGDEDDQQYYDNEVGNYVSNTGSKEEFSGRNDVDGKMRSGSLSVVDEGRSDLQKLTPGSTDMDEDQEQYDYRHCNSPSVQDRNDEFVSNAGLLQTPDSQHSPTTEKPGHRVQFSDSPGVLEAGYETFATAAAKRGFVSPCGDSQMMTVGSPSENAGWLDFIPNLLSRGKQQKAQTSSEIDPLLLNGRESTESFTLNHSLEDYPTHTNSTSYDPSTVADGSPHRYTHFKFHTNRSTSSDMPDPPLHYPPRTTPNLFTGEGDRSSQLAYALNHSSPPMTPVDTPFISEPSSSEQSVHVTATAVGGLMPLPKTPMTPPMTPISEKMKGYNGENSSTGIGGFGVPLKMLPSESSELLRPSHTNSRSFSNSESKSGLSQFYSFQNKDDNNSSYWKSSAYNDSGQTGEYDGGDESERMGSSNMISFYSGGNDGYYSIRSPTKVVSRLHNHSQHHSENLQHHRLSSSSSQKSKSDSGVNFIKSFLFGNTYNASGNKETVSNQGPVSQHQVPAQSSSHEPIRTHHRSASTQKRAAAAARRKQARLRKQRQLQRRRERVPEHLRLAHARAAAITERFRGLLRAEVEKVILFANSRLGELSDTIGSLRYSTYEDGQEEMRKYPSLADGGIHHLSSSDSDGDSVASSIMSQHRVEDDDSNRDSRTFKSDSSKDETKKQIMLRDRLRISRPMFQKADFLGEDFSLLSAVDETDAYTAIGVELMHLLKYVCINIIAVRKICKKHDRLFYQRMTGGYYQRLASEANQSHSQKQHHLFRLNDNVATQPQFGSSLSNPATSTGHILGIYDTKIQHIANSTTMHTVSSSLAIALSDFEASQSRSLLGLGFGPKGEREGQAKAEFSQQPEVPSPRHQTLAASRLRDAVTSQISGHCFREEDDSTVEEDRGEDNASTSSNTALTRLQFVVTSAFGLREAARIRKASFESYASRLFMISIGPNITGEGLSGCSRETLEFLCSYSPDAAYTLDMDTLYSSLKNNGHGKDDGIGGVMVASLAAAAKGYEHTSNRSRFRRHVASAMSIDPQATGEENDVPSFRNKQYQNILLLNTTAYALYLASYVSAVPTAHIFSTSLGSRSSAAALIGITNISAILNLLTHTVLMSKRTSFIRRRNMELADFRTALILCSMFALVGNILYSLSLSNMSFWMAIIGRFLVGFGSSELLNIQLLPAIVPQESVNNEVARLAKLAMVTMPASLVFGSLVDIKVKKHTSMTPQLVEQMVSVMPSQTPVSNVSVVTLPEAQPFLPLVPPSIFGERSLLSLESVGYAMAFAWFIQLIGLVFFFDIPRSKARRSEAHPHELKLHTTQEEDFDSDTEYETTETPVTDEIGQNGTFEKLQTMSRKTVRHQSQHTYRESLTNIRRLMFSNVAFPTTIAIYFIAKITTEMLLASCGTISSRYFGWSGARCGLFMGLMAAMILPINMNLASRNSTERDIIKAMLETSRRGLIFMLNYESLFFFIMAIVEGGRKDSTTNYYYDGMLGLLQYTGGFAIIFFSVITLESTSLTLMSRVQVAPRQMKKYTIDNVFVIVFVSAVARLFGDVLILAFDSLRLSDMVNSICISLILAFTLGIYIVRKHFFFLI